jgi:hypothetical protein
MAKVKFAAGGGGQIRGARRAGSSGLQAAPAATRTSPDTLGPGPRAGSSGASHRASAAAPRAAPIRPGRVQRRRSGISDELPLELTSDNWNCMGTILATTSTTDRATGSRARRGRPSSRVQKKKGGKDWMITCTQRATQKS